MFGLMKDAQNGGICGEKTLRACPSEPSSPHQWSVETEGRVRTSAPVYACIINPMSSLLLVYFSHAISGVSSTYRFLKSKAFLVKIQHPNIRLTGSISGSWDRGRGCTTSRGASADRRGTHNVENTGKCPKKGCRSLTESMMSFIMPYRPYVSCRRSLAKPFLFF